MTHTERRRRTFELVAAWHRALLVRTKGRPASLGQGRRALVLETTGRRSGQLRRVTLAYIAHGDGYMVLASNYGKETPPAWWFNLQTEPDAEVLVAGRRVAVRAHDAEGDERAALVPRVQRANAHWRSYLTDTRREIPFVVLARRATV